MTGFKTHTLPQMFESLPLPVLSAVPDVSITGIYLDSRQVQPGGLFVAILGENTDGHRYIQQALDNGAVVILGDRADIPSQMPYVRVADTRLALALLSAAFYSFPARHLSMIGVTGTDGKTTTASLIYHILLAAGFRAGIISTVNATIGDEVLDTGFHVTTPEAPDVQRYLARMVNAGLTHAVLEATSHGLHQHRVSGCEFDVAVVTNITHEHLNYHGTYEAYLEAKARLFTCLDKTPPKSQGNPRTAVLNRDDHSYHFLKTVATGRQITYSMEGDATLQANQIQSTPAGLIFHAVGPGFNFPVQSCLAGLFNVSNILAAIGATVIGLDIAPAAAQSGIALFQGVPGRMERINLGQNFIAIVDFAHTPNALEQALKTARQMAEGRVITVFGSAGARDRMKRRWMAEVSARLADISIFTAEDPRTESLEGILSEMVQGALSQGGVEGRTFWSTPDRGDALRQAVAMARPGDLVITCGKGHEQSMCFGTTEYAWDDRTALRAALREHLGIEGPAMPYLPTQTNH